MEKSCFKQNYCHACHTRFAVFFPLPSRCVSSLLGKLIFPDSNRGTAELGFRGNYIGVAMAHTEVWKESRPRKMRIFLFY